MEIAKEQKPGRFEATMRGEFVFCDHKQFRELLDQLADPSVKQVVLNMAALTFIDSAALGMLLLAHDEAEKYGKQIVLQGIAGQVKKVMEIARFDQLFTLEDAP